MAQKSRIYISSPYSLEESRQNLRKAILKFLGEADFECQEFGKTGLPKRMGWSFEQAQDVMKRCHGTLVLALARWWVEAEPDSIPIPSEYNHFEGALSLGQSLPTMIVCEKTMGLRGILSYANGQLITHIDLDAMIAAGALSDTDAAYRWLRASNFLDDFNNWRDEVRRRRHVFLAYSSKAQDTAQVIRQYLETLDYSVHDWKRDFTPSSTILEQIEEASNICLCGIFLLTKDDLLAGEDGMAAPRDNVIFEAGYFVKAWGKERAAIIIEKGAKIPADIGGIIYIPLNDRSNISATTWEDINKFLKKRL
jgi:Predicted nucleotide-binding protein containing TIR -like domain